MMKKGIREKFLKEIQDGFKPEQDFEVVDEIEELAREKIKELYARKIANYAVVIKEGETKGQIKRLLLDATESMKVLDDGAEEALGVIFDKEQKKDDAKEGE
jgi:hypothetical protein